MKILVVDDEQDICEILQYNLETEGYEVVTAHSAEEALRLPLHEMSLILLDVMMGEMSGFQMARRLKATAATAQIPIIFITALDGEDNLVKGLNIGADDYIAKPLSMKEVKARVRAVLRRTFAIDHSPFAIDHSLAQKETDVKNGQWSMFNGQYSRICHEGIVLDLNAKTVTLDGEALICTKLEFELLSFFLQHPGRVYSREDLLKYCWPQDVLVLDRTVDVNITRLRRKIGRYGKQIKTRVGYGYYFEK
jgi:DNA-binding response OmpR family regulator